MSKEDRKALFAMPIVLIIAIGFIVMIGSDHWGSIDLTKALYPVVLAFALQWIAFIPAYLKRTEKFYDLVGGMSFICVAGFCLLLAPTYSLRSIILFAMVVLWAGRLSIFLFVRVHRSGKDRRFDAIKQSFPRFLIAWTVQGLWITFTLAPVMAVILSGKQHGPDLFFVVGSLVWLFGYVFEVTADLQKYRFKSEPANKGKFISSGLWSISRHPNYFGEIALWVGVAVIAFPTLGGWQYLTLSSPLFIYCLLNYISGIPLLEKSADKRWGALESYQEYKRNTPPLFPALRWPSS
ncbi:MAG: steroid 5-alpha reductase family enzyme [Lentimonas sp.]|jgi:steroid 5-alpha reductase family enzyme